MKEVDLIVRVKTGSCNVAPDELASLVDRLINIGVDDAQETLRDGECCLDEELQHARVATQLEFTVTPAAIASVATV